MVAAQYQNVYVDTSSSNNWVNWTPHPLTVADLFRRTLDAIGCERLIFGTDSGFFPRGYRSNILNDQLAICDDLGLSPDADRQHLRWQHPAYSRIAGGGGPR